MNFIIWLIVGGFAAPMFRSCIKQGDFSLGSPGVSLLGSIILVMGVSRETRERALRP